MNTKNIRILKGLQSNVFTAVSTLCFTHYTGQSTVNNFFKSFLLSVPMYMCNSMHYQICAAILSQNMTFLVQTQQRKNYCQIIFNSAFANLIFSTTLRLYFEKPKV